jgi:hypothetical protein
MKFYKIIAILISALLFASSVFAMSTANERQFRVIMGMSLEELGNTSAKLLKANYPDTKWTDYNFPNYVYGDLATEIAYKVAVKDPELLGISNIQDDEIVIPCYCTCDSFGHDNLLYCFYSHGDSRRGFDEHGAQCGVCIRQALLAYLWSDLGATHAEIMIGMKEKFAALIEKYHDHEH